jgi:membrane-associated protease RseP (regulator of RpoE activity)
MRVSRETWSKVICGLAISLAAAPLSAHVFAPLALAAEEGSDKPAPEQGDYWIGVRCTEVPPLLRAQLDLAEGQGVLIDDVVPDSPAKKAGLKAFDVIVSIDGQPVGDPQAVAETVARSGEEELKIDYLRGGRKETLTVKPAPRPESIAPQRHDQRALQQWVERLGRGPAPMRFRFFHPGMVLPPGASIAPALPDDMTVTIEKKGDKPAKITAKQGEKTWETNEDALDKLPSEAREFAEHLLGLRVFDLGAEGAPMPGGPPVRALAPERHDPEARFNRRIDEMSRQIDELRQAIEKLRAQQQP